MGVLVGLAGVGCGGGGGPTDELESLFQGLASPNVAPSRFSEELVAVLDSDTRAAVVARAKALGERLGVPVEPADVLQVRGVLHNARVIRVEAIQQDAERATLELTLSPIEFPGSADAPGAKPAADAAPSATPDMASNASTASTVSGPFTTSIRLPVVKEGGHWRIAFGGLAQLVSSLSLNAPATGAADPASPSRHPEPSEMSVP